jgi:2-keto-3-deoxy-L-rhamnonate aldolase RhmA
MAAVQSETMEALEAIDEIVGVPGLASLFIGPMDLSGALGRLGQANHPDVVAAMETIVAKARGADLFIGAGLGPDVEFACVLARRSVQWMHVGNDFSHLVKAMDELAAAIRDGLGDY